MLHSDQIRTARTMLKMTASDLANVTGLHLTTIQRFEKDNGALKKSSFETINKIKTAFEERGIRFLPPKEDGSIDGIGVRYFPSESKKPEAKEK